MINETDTKNLNWLMPSNHQMDGYWFAIEPTPTAWKIIEKIQDFVGLELGKEKITTWVPYPHKLSHVTVFLGLNEMTTPQEKAAVMRRVAEKISQINDFKIDFKLKDTILSRGPGNYITLKFNSPMINVINVKIREAVNEAINASEIDQKHLYSNGNGDKLNLDIEPHLTIGTLDVDESPQIPWAEKHKDIKTLYNKERKSQFEQLFLHKAKNEFSHLQVSFPVTNVELLGTNKKNKLISQKEYMTLASCGLNQTINLISAFQGIQLKQPEIKTGIQINQPEIKINSHKPSYESKDEPALSKIKNLSEAILNKNLILKLKLDEDERNQLLISVGFKDLDDAKTFLMLAEESISGKVMSKDDLHWVRLGKKRMNNLFGKDGEKLYNQAISELLC